MSTTPEDGKAVATLPDEALGRAPGRGRLTGRRILVVGAGTRGTGHADDPVGNGQAIARLAAREGAAVDCADVERASAEATAAAIAAEGGAARVLVGDVAEPAACARIVEEAAAAGGLAGLVCNVGIGAGAGLEGTSVDDWDGTFAVNLRSHFLLARAALPRLPRGGAIVFVGSIAGLVPGSGIPAYDASKAGLFGLSRHVAAEGARRGVRANLVVPGLIDTPLGRWATAGRPGRAATRVPLGRQGTAWEIAHATVFLLSDEASYVTGQALVVDGGLTFR